MRIVGWIPCARSRSSSMAIRRCVSASSKSPGARSGLRRDSSLAVASWPASIVSVSWAPSWRLFSSRRRSRSANAYQARARFEQAFRDRLALGDDGGEEHRRQRRHGDVQLRAERAARNRVDDERARVMGRLPERDADGDRNGERAAARPEAQRGPDQGRKDDVHERPVGPQRDVGEDDHRAQHQSSFGDSRPRPGQLERLPPGERERDDDERARGVPEPPGVPDVRQVRRRQHVAEA